MSSSPPGIPPNSQFLLTGYNSPTLSGYAPADFLDADETRPIELLLDQTATGSTTPYTTVVSNTLYRHLGEIREQNVPPQVVANNWKKKLRDFITTKNEDLLSFMSRRLPESSPLSKVSNFMKKYIRTESALSNSNKDKFIDISGQDRVQFLDELEKELQEHGKSKYVELIFQVKYIIDSYRTAGENVIRLEAVLQGKLAILDKAVQRLTAVCSLEQNSAFQPLMDSIQSYLTIVFDENKIEETYNELVQAYKKLFFLREALQFVWTLEGAQREPLCAICFNEPIQFAMVPCGHTFCSSCVKRQITACYICRVQVREKIKLYFG
jgi:hypothetical protein